MNVSVWIRTHTQRLYIANELKATCDKIFMQSSTLLHTGCRSRYYSQKFMLCLESAVASCATEYVLLLEDDMLCTPTSLRAVSEGIRRGDSHNWYSVDITSGLLQSSICVPGYGYILNRADHISFSGAILIRTDILKVFIEHYCIHALEYEYPNFDVTFSAFLLKEFGHIHIRPGHFIPDARVQSSISNDTPGRISDTNGVYKDYRGPYV